MPQKSAADIVADARKAYASAGGGKMKPVPVSVTPVKTETAVMKKASPTTMDELAVRRANIDKVKASLPKLHTGGTVPKDGAYQLKAGEHVLTAKEAARTRKHVLISAGLRSMATPTPKAGKAETAARPTESKAVSAVKVRPEKDQAKKISIKK